jgi:hypothetical protein
VSADLKMLPCDPGLYETPSGELTVQRGELCEAVLRRGWDRQVEVAWQPDSANLYAIREREAGETIGESYFYDLARQEQRPFQLRETPDSAEGLAAAIDLGAGREVPR